MARTIKRVSHDLIPLSDATIDLNDVILELLTNIESHVTFDNEKISTYFKNCIEASQNLAGTSKLVRTYLAELDKEADNAGILKD